MPPQTINPFPSLQSALVDPKTGIVTQAWYRLLLRLAMQNMPGEIILAAAGNVPETTLLCDGSAVSRTQYSALFQAIGITFGPGDGSTTFNLPNIAGPVADVEYYIHY